MLERIIWKRGIYQQKERWVINKGSFIKVCKLTSWREDKWNCFLCTIPLCLPQPRRHIRKNFRQALFLVTETVTDTTYPITNEGCKSKALETKQISNWNCYKHLCRQTELVRNTQHRKEYSTFDGVSYKHTDRERKFNNSAKSLYCSTRIETKEICNWFMTVDYTVEI